MRRSLVAALGVLALLVPASGAAAQDHGVGEWERCQNDAYARLDYTDPESVEAFLAVSVQCAVRMQRDLSDPARIGQLRRCLYEGVKRSILSPIGWGPLFVTSGAWYCVVIEYLGRDVKVPPGPAASGVSPARSDAPRRACPRPRDRGRDRSRRARAGRCAS